MRSRNISIKQKQQVVHVQACGFICNEVLRNQNSKHSGRAHAVGLRNVCAKIVTYFRCDERERERERLQRERGGGREGYSTRDRERGGRERYNEREGGETAREGRGTVGQTDRQIYVQMTYVMQYFHFENSFE